MANLSSQITERIDLARDIIFRARGIVAVVGAAAMSEDPADPVMIQITLSYVAEILGDVAEMLDSAELAKIHRIAPGPDREPG